MSTRKLRVCIINSNPEYIRMFRARGWSTNSSVATADLIQFTGGSDVSPSLYGEPSHRTTRTSWARDQREIMVFRMAMESHKPMAGICRGGQFLNVMCGGGMYQDVNGHALPGTHEAFDTRTGEAFDVTSTHHQMMIPSPSDNGVVIVKANACTMRTRMDKDANEITAYGNNAEDVEAIIYSNERVFCFQPHPEFEGRDALADRYFKYLNEFLT